jgi:hypothetical protein
VNKAVEQERAKIIKDANLKADEIDKLNKGQDLDKIKITKEQREEYVRVLQQAYQFLQQAQELGEPRGWPVGPGNRQDVHRRRQARRSPRR